MKKKILIIHTGGTISMIEDEITGAVVESNQNPLTNFINKNEHLDFIVEEPFMLPSPYITPVEMLELKCLIEKNVLENQVSGVVITHGTDTLEETAYFLDLSLNVKIPVVVTGAMRSSNELGSDGLSNLISSIRVASSENSIDKGVLVVLNDEIHTAMNVTKTHTSNLSTFQSPQYGPIGSVTKRAVLFHHFPLLKNKFNVKKVNKKVALIKAHAGLDSSIFFALANMNIDGVVIEALGQGNLPPQTLPGIEKLLAMNVQIVLVSRCFNGIVEDIYDYLGGGHYLKKKGLIFSNGLNGQKARIKLLLALCNENGIEDLHAAFS
ncbi:MAG: asparaginase [Bacillales bacterium]|jgi:L-asparaginase|nr:asparaginase [Bacillales bacterium]